MKKYILFGTLFLALSSFSFTKAETLEEINNDLASTKIKITQINKDLENNKNKLSELNRTKDSINQAISNNTTELSNDKIEEQRKEKASELSVRKEQDVAKHIAKDKDLSDLENPFSDFTQINNIKINKIIKELKHLDNEELKNVLVSNGADAQQVISKNIKETEDKIVQLESELKGNQEHYNNRISDKETKEQNLYEDALINLASDFDNPADQALYNKVAANSQAEDGLTINTTRMKKFLAAKFGVTSFSTYRAGDDDGTGHGHSSGLAVDFMVSKNQGDELAAYLAKNFNELNVYYIIWEQKYYMNMTNIYGPAYTWNLMPDRGGITANHYDHVHVSFRS